MITRQKVSSILISLVALTHGTGALKAGNKPITTAIFTWLLVSSGPASLADPGPAAAAGTAKVGQPLHLNGTGPAPATRAEPKAAPEAGQGAAAPDTVTRAFTAALRTFQETVYLDHLFANPDGSPLRAGQEIPAPEAASDQAPGAEAEHLRKALWTTTLERVSALDRAVMDGLSEFLQAPAGRRLPDLEKRMVAIKARSLELEAELRKASQDFHQARTAFEASHPGQALRSDLLDDLLQDLPDGQEPRDPQFTLQLEAMRVHMERVKFMGNAIQRYLSAFLAATAELVPERKPFPDEDERSAGKSPASRQTQASKAAETTAEQQKAPKRRPKAFVTRGRQDKDAPADGRFSIRNEL